MKGYFFVLTSFFIICFFISCNKEHNNSIIDNITVIQENGNIQDDVERFRNMLGTLNTEPGATGGRREINWDGIPDNLDNTPLPPDFFNPTGENAPAARQRGLVYSSAGSFMVSSDGFATINSEASSQFTAFSGSKTFANTSAKLWDNTFQKPGTTQAASVQAYGLVFSDVDKGNSTALQFFNGSKSIGKYFVPAHDASSGFSFLAVFFKNGEKITKVTISHEGLLVQGNKDVSDGGTDDLIVMDDFIYSEPINIE
jgi:hypothetical protein